MVAWGESSSPRKLVRVMHIREHRPAGSVLANVHGSRRFQGFHPGDHRSPPRGCTARGVHSRLGRIAQSLPGSGCR